MLRALAALTIIALALPASGASPVADYHLTSDAGSALYSASPFAHGFRHGYEEGFHDGDRDFHLSAFSLDEVLVPRKVPKTVGYWPAFGSKDRFRKGYEAGYRLGYADSMKAVPFRGHAPQIDALISPDRDFDRGVQYGYSTAGADCSERSASFCAGMQAGRALAHAAEAGTHVAAK